MMATSKMEIVIRFPDSERKKFEEYLERIAILVDRFAAMEEKLIAIQEAIPDG
jgi:hypothetical protein